MTITCRLVGLHPITEVQPSENTVMVPPLPSKHLTKSTILLPTPGEIVPLLSEKSAPGQINHQPQLQTVRKNERAFRSVCLIPVRVMYQEKIESLPRKGSLSIPSEQAVRVWNP